MTTDGLTYPTNLNEPGAIEALLAFHRSVFGDARMEADDTDSEEGTDSTEESEGTESQEGTDADTDSADDESDEDGDEEDGEDVPADVLRKQLTRANADAANFRTKLREAQAKLDSAKTVEEFEEATKGLNDKIAELEWTILRDKVARKFKLPDDLAERLTGDTEDDLRTDAKKLAKFIPSGNARLAGGLDPSGDDEAFDAVKEARRARTRRY